MGDFELFWNAFYLCGYHEHIRLNKNVMCFILCNLCQWKTNHVADRAAFRHYLQEVWVWTCLLGMQCVREQWWVVPTTPWLAQLQWEQGNAIIKPLEKRWRCVNVLIPFLTFPPLFHLADSQTTVKTRKCHYEAPGERWKRVRALSPFFAFPSLFDLHNATRSVVIHPFMSTPSFLPSLYILHHTPPLFSHFL